MKIYFVRHGESEGNANIVIQAHDTPLSEKGRQQAKILAKRFADIQIDAILSSPYARALSTAQEIAHWKNLHVIESELLHERKPPTDLEGIPHDDPRVSEYFAQTGVYVMNPQWHYSDDPLEENIFDLRLRAVQAKEFIQSQQYDSICVLSHGRFLTCLFCVIILGDDIDVGLIDAFFHHIELSNTGISEVNYDNNEKKWTFMTINDDAHLGELG